MNKVNEPLNTLNTSNLVSYPIGKRVKGDSLRREILLVDGIIPDKVQYVYRECNSIYQNWSHRASVNLSCTPYWKAASEKRDKYTR